MTKVKSLYSVMSQEGKLEELRYLREQIALRIQWHFGIGDALAEANPKAAVCLNLALSAYEDALELLEAQLREGRTHDPS